jgi:hypothetical protein
METMELSDLQRAAFGPTLWHRKVLHHATLKGKARALSRVERPLRYDPTTIDKFESMFLIPGGRYAISHTKTSIQLWDLDGPVLSSRTTEIIDSVFTEAGTELAELSEVVRHGECLRFCSVTAPVKKDKLWT